MTQTNRSKDWMAQAERDFERAKIDVQYAYYEWACFVCQQAAEKAVKAVHYSQNRGVRGHGILHLLTDLIESMDDPQRRELQTAARILDRYYVEARYPNGFPAGKPADYFDDQIAGEAMNACEKILSFCRDRLHRS